MVNLTALTWVRFGVWLVVGIAIYLGYGRRHSVQGRRQADEAEQDAALDTCDSWFTKCHLMSRHKTQTAVLSNLNVV